MACYQYECTHQLLICASHNSGDVCDWKNFSSLYAENEIFDKELSDKLVDSSVSLKY